MKRYGTLRWVLLAVGIVAILGITAMNVYSLYALRENTLESNRENKKLQITEFTDKVRFRFFESFVGLGSKDIKHLQSTFQQTGQFTNEMNELLIDASKDSIYKNIYFISGNSGKCKDNKPILTYNGSQEEFTSIADYPEVVCDGMSIARTQMKSLINDYENSSKVIFDSHRSIIIALIIPSENTIFGYLIMPFDQDYLTNEYLPKKITENFGGPEQAGITVWLRDWTNNKIIASSNPYINYSPEKVNFEQNFPDLFDYWKLHVAFTEQSAVAASNASLYRNLAVLSIAIIILLGALVFMFISAQKERALAQQQAGFLANVTHELKTPLSVMQAAGENLADGRVTDQRRLKRYGGHIYNEAVRLRSMIEKLLDVAKIDAGKSLIDPEPVDLSQAVNSYIEEHWDYINEKGFSLQTSIEDDTPMVMIDSGSFNTIITNLVENALKYSPNSKSIYIRLYSENGEVTLEVEDNGIGMTKKVKSQIFDKFYRAEDTLTAKTKGHGLGLSIVKNLVELNEGSITVSTEPEQGSTFIVTFPIISDTSEKVGEVPDEESSENKHDSLNKDSESYV
ncbi:Signal transduction histidine kinase [Fodinibius salinus]|uniref:histidine kinase n=1 Tax=Fodinibius salinus TaxID=860790 RepID=A0A5D3YFN0_9BACT|nr:HAMP domain-containing sensor histidine kinase [Fodinibius salinus]TYP92025.1 Signal transduction histidine kinase [Fodinibius salinus]